MRKVLNQTEKGEVLTEEEQIKLTRQGSSKGFTIPHHLLKVFRNLECEPRIFYIHVERDENGNLTLIIRKPKTEAPRRATP